MKKIGVVLGEFHKSLVAQMLEEARIVAYEAELEIVDEVWVPGSVEKPLAIKRLLDKGVDGVVVLGIIEKGETQHGFVMGQALMQTVMNLQVEYGKPISLGVLGPGIEHHQIEVRLKPYAHKAVHAVAHMLS